MTEAIRIEKEEESHHWQQITLKIDSTAVVKAVQRLYTYIGSSLQKDSAASLTTDGRKVKDEP